MLLEGVEELTMRVEMLLRGRDFAMVKHAQKDRQSPNQTHRAAQFAVASELCKHGYEVAVTMGNHPVIDLMVVSPKGVPFLIDVIGQYKRNFWPVRLRKARGRLFYVLAFVPSVGHNRFFILAQEAVEKEIERGLQHTVDHRKARGLDGERLSLPNVGWGFAKNHEGAWKVLPE